MMQHKGYYGNAVFDDTNDILHGEVIGIKDVVTFQGESVQELRRAFEGSVDDYLEFCKERGETPAKPCSGRFVLRLSPELHGRISTIAKSHHQSLNSWVVTQLEKSSTESQESSEVS